MVGPERTQEIGAKAARLIGLQNYPQLAKAVGAEEGGPLEAAHFLAEAMAGMGDSCVVDATDSRSVHVEQTGLRIVRDLSADSADNLLLLLGRNLARCHSVPERVSCCQLRRICRQIGLAHIARPLVLKRVYR